jgi:hypothetical protein
LSCKQANGRVTDRANGLRVRIAFVHQQQADLVVRFTPHLPLEDEQGKTIELVKWGVWTPCPGRQGRQSARLDSACGKAASAYAASAYA